MAYTLEETDWSVLMQNIRNGKCTPFVGAGACYRVLPLGEDIAKEWAKKYNYPLADCNDLVKVAQYLAVQFEPMFPKDRILERIKDIPPPDFNTPDEPHGVLADLPLSVYITTNYDGFMVKALESRMRDAKRDFCRWNKHITVKKRSVFADGFRPEPKKPVVFHLHGNDEVPESLVLTEDDYLSFLVNFSREPKLLPPRIQEALTASLLFIGYRLADWDFRVLFQGIVSSMDPNLRRLSVTVQLPPGQQDVKSYQEKYFGEITKGMKIYWGTAREFAAELRHRWEQFNKGGGKNGI